MFIRLIDEGNRRFRMRLLAFCLMPNHFHLVLWPRGDQDLGKWLQWVLTTHVRRHHMRHGTDGRIWQGRTKQFPIQEDHHLLTVMRYVERNPLRAGLVNRAEHWRWSSLSMDLVGRKVFGLAEGPLPKYLKWLQFVNEPLTVEELATVRRSVFQQIPYGSDGWISVASARHGKKYPPIGPRGGKPRTW